MSEPGAAGGPTRVVGVVGCGVTGRVVVQELASLAGVRVVVLDPDASAARAAARSPAVVVDHVDDMLVADVVALCHPEPHHPLAARLVDAGVGVVSLSGLVDDADELLGMHHRAIAARASLVVGAGMAPGLTGLIARHLGQQLHVIDELHVSVHGTGGPECARSHHEALGARALGWHDGRWIERPGGSGRELCWFPEPIGAHDCYRAALADPVLLHRAFPTAERISARISATRRDRLTARLPMLTPPHSGGNTGAVRVEVRGALEGGERSSVIAGASGRAERLAAAVAVAAVELILLGEVPFGASSPGDEGLASTDLLERACGHGVALQEFTGVARTPPAASSAPAVR